MHMNPESSPQLETYESHPSVEGENSRPIDRVAFMASGSGSTFEALARAVESGEIPAEYVMLITDSPTTKAIERAERLGVDHVALDWKKLGPEKYDRVLSQVLEKHNIGLIFMVGYLKRLGEQARQSVGGRVLNTHPALLEDDPAERRYGGPGMFGEHVHEAVFNNGESVSGATVHMADGQFDHGPVLRRAESDISLAKTKGEVNQLVQREEKPLVISVLRDVLTGSLELPSIE
jgi:phosphoribosylglycinamide formyltransferase-1